MRLLGAILAGGKASRFGSDKAAAIIDGLPLIEHVAAALARVTQAVIVVGRDWPGMESVADRPAAGMGPLGGLCGALCYGRDAGFDAVVTAGCDMMPVVLPPLPSLEGAAMDPAYIADHFLSAIWPTALASGLESHMTKTSDLSLRGWIKACDAQPVTSSAPFYNLNTPNDLARYQAMSATPKSGEE